jgi:hypothetical protein
MTSEPFYGLLEKRRRATNGNNVPLKPPQMGY